MRAPIASNWKDRLPSALTALAFQAALFALLAFSFTAIVRAPEKEQEVIFLLPRPAPAPPSDPMVIDARPRRATPTPPSAATSGLSAAPGGNGITAAPPATQAPAPEALTQSLGRELDCRAEVEKRSPLCPIARPGPNAFDPNPPSGVQDEERWAREKARADGPADLGVAVGPGVGFVIPDPLCKLAWVLLGGGFRCAAPPRSTRPATDEQFKAALDAYHKRRGGGPKPALTSAKPGENGNEKDRIGGHGGGADFQPGPGANP